MGLFYINKEPIFLRESCNAQEQLEKLKALEPLLNPEGQKIIKQDIKNLEYGIAGEKNIAFELKNSHMTMYILHDIYIDNGDLSAQIDYLVFTRKLCFVIECKNLYGDIEINSAGDFIRTTKFGGKTKKEGIYSPITQNQRHFEIIRRMNIDGYKNAALRFLVDKTFENFFTPIVVLANPKTVLNDKFAKKDVKEKVIRADQLVKYIKDKNKSSKVAVSSDTETLKSAQSFMKLHKEVEKDYTEKYNQYKICDNEPDNAQPISSSVKENINPVETEMPVENTKLFEELKAYRLNKSREEKIKPYFIYNNNQLNDLISKMPRSKEELQTVNGFAEVKANKYGDDIIKIINKY